MFAKSVLIALVMSYFAFVVLADDPPATPAPTPAPPATTTSGADGLFFGFQILAASAFSVAVAMISRQ